MDKRRGIPAERRKKLKGAIFDLDGTLLDSMKIWEQIDIDFLTRRGVVPTPDYTTAVTSMDSRSAAEYTIRRYGFRDTPEMLMAEWTQMCREAYCRTVPLKPGAGELVKALFSRGIRIAAATALSPGAFEPALLQAGSCGLLFCVCRAARSRRGKGSRMFIAGGERLQLRRSNALYLKIF